MAPRLDLQQMLKTILGSDHVYFQPPPTVQMSYPAIVYKLDDIPKKTAGNSVYKVDRKYQITVIDRNPDSEVYDALIRMPRSTFERHFIAEGLNHFVLTLFF